jgi:predicted nuclease of predicted toxin-antitoxin system
VNLVADESVDARIVRRLRVDGHAVDSIAELSPSIDDDEVLSIAAGSGRVLVTADKDFGELVYRLRRAHAGVVLLRLAGLQSADRAEFVAEVVEARATDLPGAFTVIEPDSIRVRRPPSS